MKRSKKRPGRRCRVCRKVRWYSDFKPSNARVCQPCKAEGSAIVYSGQCAVCGDAFESSCVRALYCSPRCRYVQTLQRRREQRRHMRAAARAALAGDA